MTATGPLSVPVDALRTLVSESSTFQTWTGAANAAQALNSIFLVSADESETRPLALINTGPDWRITRNAQSAAIPSGGLLISFEDDVTGSDAAAAEDFLNQCGGVLSDIMTASGTSGTICIHDILFETPPSRATEDDEVAQGDFFYVRFNVMWGI